MKHSHNAVGMDQGDIRLIRISLSAMPSRRCVRITLRLVICPCGTPSAGSSSILASTYPTTLGYSSPAPAPEPAPSFLLWR